MNKQCAVIAAGLALSSGAYAADSWSVYAGADYLITEISTSRTLEPTGDQQMGANQRADGDADAVRLKAGLWLSEDFAVEVQGAVSQDEAEAPDTGEIESYVGVFILPRAQVLDWLDMVFPVGISMVDAVVFAENPEDENQFDRIETSNESISYGVNFNIGLGRLFGGEDSIVSGFDLTAGFMVYDTANESNIRGVNAGIQFGYDF